MTIKKPADFIASLALFGIVGMVYQQSRQIEVTTVHAYGPNFFPSILMGALLLFAVCLAWQSIDFSGEKNANGNRTIINRTALILQSSFVAALVAYLIVMPFIGYVPSTFLFLFSAMALLGERKPKNLAFYAFLACVVTGVLYYIFGELLLLFLP